MSDRDERAARLAEQLRANLRRRKAQARATQAAERADEGDTPAAASPPPRDEPA
ncbi:hypothetical protein KZ813_07635 [Sphingomonas sp. RHCKR7]|uniref:hypothetical protein n=1 Tax=Sphingomonas folli TaxID=2862497 RepID=UPI001CA51721|nr:hypothetical protein [Sphingomonas folli]MBW6526705.1 hypothetical protein [Sphingomonas folli]